MHRNSYAPSSPQHSWSGTISPVVLPFCQASPTFYSRVYFYLRAQETILQSVERSIKSLDQIETDDDMQAVSKFSSVVSTLLTADYANMFQYAVGAVSQINECLLQNLTPQIEKIGYSLLSSAIAVSRLLTLVSYNNGVPSLPDERIVEPVQEPAPPKRHGRRSNMMQSPSNDTFLLHRPRKSRRLSKGHLSGSCSNFSDQSYVVCRICEKQVPLFLIEAHSRNCVLAYESSKTMVSTDDRMRKLQALARQTILRTQWPGCEKTAVSVILPVLHGVVLLDRAIAADPTCEGTSDELDMICEALMPIALSMSNSDAAEILKKASNLVSEKLNATAKLNQAMDVIHRTSLTPEGISNISVGQTTIADFEFVKRISSGAYARVFLAKKKTTGDIYAIKVLPKTGLRQKNEVRRVLVEKDILLKVRSPFMIKFFYSIIGEHNLYLVMEYLPGGDLYSILQNIGCLDEQDAKIYTAQIVSALEFLRNNNIIHRDLKPDNILVDASGKLKLTDFGLSFFGMVDRSISSNQTFDESFVGTPDYTSPEIVMSQRHTFTADYWALGTLLYEFLTGVPPFHGETPAETFQHIIKGHYDEEELEECTPEVRAFIKSLLCHDPEKRLGAKSIDEIKQHPWFDGIDWDHIEDLPPPFVPSLNSKFDTSYFEERYDFQSRDESDILEDMRLVQTQQASPREECHRASILSLLDDEVITSEQEEENDIDSFSSVAVHQLQATTNETARQMRKMSGVPDEDVANYLESNSDLVTSPAKKRTRRRLPRASLTPKTLAGTT